MLEHDLDLSFSDIAGLTGREEVRAFFARLGYPVQTGKETFPDAEGMNQRLCEAVQHIELLARDDTELLDVYLIEFPSVTVARINDLGTHFKSRGGWALAVLTSDYERIDFVLFDLQRKDGRSTSVHANPRPFSIDRLHPENERVILRVLRRMSWTERDALAQWEKLRSAFQIAEWSEEFFDNRGLFSDYFLKERLPDQSEVWSPDNLKQMRREIGGRLVEARQEFSGKDEAAVRTGLLEPVLEQLGFEVKSEKGPEDEDTGRPDYELRDGETGEKLAVCLAYQWDRFLDGPDPSDKQTESENPGAAVLSLLEQDDNEWAIVTNGKQWRLYTRKTESRATNFFQVDAEEAAADADPDAFRYFWLLFRAEAFRKWETPVEGETRVLNFLEQLLEDSRDYAKRVGDSLKKRVFNYIFPILAEGFVADIRAREGSDADLSQQRLDLIYESTLVLLYRLLFLLYSESRGLLPVREVGGFYEKSLTRIKRKLDDTGGTVESARDAKLAQAYSDAPVTSREDSTLYGQLDELFKIVAEGRPSVKVPPYNGGLFVLKPEEALDEREREIAQFLSDYALPDLHLARTIDYLARDIDEKTHGLAMIDYKSLGVRQLGSIYEGLLEFKLRVAPEKMAICKQKSTEIVLPYDEAQETSGVTIQKTGRSADAEELTIPEGAPYLENDKHERKSTGSYYTPDYIVSYIVEHTVGPVLEEKFAEVRDELDRACQRFHKLDKQRRDADMKRPTGVFDEEKPLIDRVFDIRVLDPAMGSGHFLVTAVDFIADRMIHFLNGFPGNPVERLLAETRRQILQDVDKREITIDPKKLTNVNLLKRHVLKRCLYGVDLNRMAVELAKVSLWLHCFTLGAPLSFLDHHLKPGNSLIGEVGAAASVAEQDGQATLGGMSRWDQFARAVQSYMMVSQLADATADQVLASRKAFQEAEKLLGEHRAECNVLTARCFEKWTDTQVGSAQQTSTSEGRAMFELGQELADEHRFFHWPLEFPGIWYGTRPETERVIAPKPKHQQGFDAVVGNPPYVRQEQLGRMKPYLAQSYAAYQGTADIYVYFFNRGVHLLRHEGRHGFISSNKFMRASYGKELRRLLTTEAHVEQIVDFGELPVFEDSSTFPVIVLFSKGHNDTEALFAQIQCLTFHSLEAEVEREGTLLPAEAFEGHNWSLVSAEQHEIMQKMERLGQPLNSCVDSQIYRGVTTGFNEAFVIDHATRGRLIARNAKSAEIIKPLIIGDDVRRYSVDRRQRYLIFSRQGIDIDKYPAIKEHLANWKQQLTPKGDRTQSGPGRKPGDYQWYEIQDTTDYYGEFEKTKILLPAFALEAKFTVDRAGFFVNAPCYFLASDDTFILAILNSKLGFAALMKLCSVLGDERLGGRAVLRPAYYEDRFPVRVTDIDHPTAKDNKEPLLEQTREAIGVDDYEIPLHLTKQALATHALLHGPAGKPELKEDAYWKEQIVQADPDFPGREDFVHDLLAMLAQRMMDLNKDKHAEIDRFLTWLQDELGFDVEDFTGKTFVKAYYEHDWDELLRRLQQNKRHCANPVEGLFVGNIRVEYEASVEKLQPIQEALEKTDRLIDQIVYKLYGLTDEEIAIVEESFAE